MILPTGASLDYGGCVVSATVWADGLAVSAMAVLYVVCWDGHMAYGV